LLNLQVEKYLQAVPAERKARMKEIHSMILDLFPDAVVDMTYKMPTYGYHHIESFKTKYPKIKTGKGCINFRDTMRYRFLICGI